MIRSSIAQKQADRIRALEAERDRLWSEMRKLPEGPERWDSREKLFEVGCEIRAERDRAAGVLWRCENCGFTTRPTTWLETCPECGTRWTEVRA